MAKMLGARAGFGCKCCRDDLPKKEKKVAKVREKRAWKAEAEAR